MVPILTAPEHRWGCPSCATTAVTRRSDPHTEFHHCPKLGILAPMVEFYGDALDARAARHLRVEREDYVGDELVRLDDNGRPVMSIVTEHADGSTDAAVFAPTATPH